MKDINGMRFSFNFDLNHKPKKVKRKVKRELLNVTIKTYPAFNFQSCTSSGFLRSPPKIYFPHIPHLHLLAITELRSSKNFKNRVSSVGIYRISCFSWSVYIRITRLNYTTNIETVTFSSPMKMSTASMNENFKTNSRW